MPKLKFGRIGNWPLARLKSFIDDQLQELPDAHWKEDDNGGIFWRPNMSGTAHTDAGPAYPGSISGAVYILNPSPSQDEEYGAGMIINYDGPAYVSSSDAAFNPYYAGAETPQLEIRGNLYNKNAAITLTNKETKNSQLISASLGTINFYTYATGSANPSSADFRVDTTNWHSPTMPDFLGATNIVFRNNRHRTGSGTTGLEESMRINHYGFLGIDRKAPKTRLDVVHNYDHNESAKNHYTSSLATGEGGGDIIKVGTWLGAVAKGQIVVLRHSTGATNDPAEWIPAHGNDSTGVYIYENYGNLLGIALTSGITGDQSTVLLKGFARIPSAYIDNADTNRRWGAPVYLSVTGSGNIMFEPWTSGGTSAWDSGDVIRMVGHCITGSHATNEFLIYFNPENTWNVSD